MQEIATQKDFDYSLVDNETASFLKLKEQEMQTIVLNNSIQLGDKLIEAQDKLAKYNTGTFEKWFTSIGLKKQTVYNYINQAKFVHQMDESTQIEMFQELPTTLKTEISKPSAKQEAVEMVLSGDIKTTKEYKELERKLKESEERNKRLAEQALQKEVIEKEVVIEKVPEDYESTKQLNSDLLNKNRHLNYDNENLQRVIKIKEHELKRLEDDSHEAIALKETIESLRTDKEKLEGTYKNAMELSSLLSEFENFFDEKMAPLRFKAVIAGLGTEFQLKKLRDMLTLVDSWLTEMNKVVPDEGRKIIEGEIING